MPKSKGKFLGLQHCLDLLENHEKWKSRNDDDDSSKARKGMNSSPEMEDGEDDDDDGEERENVPRCPTLASSTGRPDGRKR